ncbi:MAG: trimethylamine methyltransferase family protein [Deltaproteobacteria bacterium]|nr:trimethylamine methyltransferase family protein [Deltaproteobacteria bacterium]
MGITTDELYFKPKLRILSDDQLKKIEMAVFEVLERTGVKLTHPKARDILSGAGAKVEGDRIRIPGWMVEEAIRKTPSRLVLGNRKGERAVVLEGDKSWFGPSLDCIDYLDPVTNERMRFTSDHCRISATVADYCDNFDWVMTIGMADDQPADIADRVVARQTITYCEKPLVVCCKDTNSMRDIYEMALTICGGKEKFDQAPIVAHYSEPISPLLYYDPAVDKMIYSVENDIPLINFPCVQSSGTAPATLAGAIIQGAAESISGAVLAQAIKPGAPFVFGAFVTVMDMKTTVFSYGASEMSIMVGALAQLAQHWNIPFYGTAGATDAKFPDAQAAAEATQQIMTAATVGSGLVHDCSSWIDHGSVVSPGFMVLVNEILGNVKQFMNGMPVTDDSMALDIIDSVGPGGNYLMEQHTLDNFRNVRYSTLFERQIRQEWEDAGSQTFEDRLREHTEKAMAHTPAPLPDDVVKELDTMQKHWK